MLLFGSFGYNKNLVQLILYYAFCRKLMFLDITIMELWVYSSPTTRIQIFYCEDKAQLNSLNFVVTRLSHVWIQLFAVWKELTFKSIRILEHIKQ